MTDRDLAHVLAYDGRFRISSGSPDGEKEVEALASIEWDESAWLNIEVESPCILHLSAKELRGMAAAIDLVIESERLVTYDG